MVQNMLGAFPNMVDGYDIYQKGQQGRANGLAALAMNSQGEQRQGALAQLAGVDADAAYKLKSGLEEQDYTSLIEGAKLVRGFRGNPEMEAQAYSRLAPQLSQRYGLQLPPQIDDTVRQSIDEIVSAQGGQEKYTGAPFVVMRNGKPEYYRYGPNGVEPTGLTAPDQYTMIQGADGYVRVPTRREGDATPINVAPPQAFGGAPQQTGANPIDALLQAVPGLRVTSRGRTPEENAALPNSVPNSFHLTGQAVDLGTPTPQQRVAIKQWAAANGHEVIENYKDGHLHVEPASRGGATTQLQGKPDAPKEPKTSIVYDADGNASVVDVSKVGPITGAVRPGSQLSAKDREKRENSKRKEFAMINSNAAKINETVRIIDELLGSGALGGVTGMGAMASNIPGTKWADAAAKLETLRAKSAFGALSEMRANSPTGGALGSVTERELSLLQNAETQLSQAQSPEAFAKALTEYKRILLESQKRMVEGVQGFYADDAQAPSAPASNRDALLDKY